MGEEFFGRETLVERVMKSDRVKGSPILYPGEHLKAQYTLREAVKKTSGLIILYCNKAFYRK